MEHDPTYTVTLRGRDFILTKSQIEFDSPNYFTTCFLGDSKEAQTRHLLLCRDPDLFIVICDYLCGYRVLPLNNRAIPARMSPEFALENIKADAAFYQLGGLIEECAALMSQTPQKGREQPQKPYLVLGCEYEHDTAGPFVEEVDKAINGPTWSTRITESRLSEIPFADMDRPEDHSGYLGLRTISAMESFAWAVRGEESSGRVAP
ncbi:hypothetical protein ACGC1H_000328 [Rhizoctonia solani]|uniref:BTB domain-containing protein n=1 Tax=Rhizoctonia solani TaxID=456999 RepID=A0A8H2WTF2_9AGAM|nr:unnamed protein product [Rhizoctonia solani]